MNRLTTDILIAGGGIAGLTAAAVLAQAGFDVICVEPNPPVTRQNDPLADLRSTAFWGPSVDLLAEAGVWTRLADHATPLSVMRIVDAGGAEATVRETVDFNSAELGRDTFGYNLPNWLIRKELLAHLDTLPSVRLLTGQRATRILSRTREMRVTLSDGQGITCALAVAADGRDSALRQAAGIACRRWGYGQKALVFAVSHTVPHDNASIEVHRTGGPFTLVPLPTQDGQHRSAAVWMETRPKAADLHALPEAAFNEAMNARSCGVLGRLDLASPRAIWPIVSQLAARLDAPRLALIAETAHVVPPIGAQGLNMSLSDLRTLRDLITGAEDPGDTALLGRYHRARWPDMATRVAGIDALNRAALADAPLLRDLRYSALKGIAGLKPLKQGLMRRGMGTGFRSDIKADRANAPR
ncbi:FAD-dependent monooxygenase [Halovulum sp. GXIMD14793]